MLKHFVKIFLLGYVFLSFQLLKSEVFAQTTNVISDFPITDGTVEVVKVHNDRLYLGGSFTYLGETTGKGGIGKLSDQTVLNFPEITGNSVNVSISDGGGGFFIAGDFTSIDGEPRSNIAHILANGDLNLDWHPSVNGIIYDLKLSPDRSILYIAGAFTEIEGISRPYTAALLTDISSVTACNITSVTIDESFEGIFPPLGWTTRDTVWTSGNTVVYDGIQSAQSAAVGNGGTSTLETSVDLTNPGVLEFYWKVSSRSNRGFLYYCIDNPTCTYSSGYRERISGEVGWVKKTIALSAGSHTITWKYSNTYYLALGSNRGWVDKVSLMEYESYPCGNSALVQNWNPSPNGEVRTITTNLDGSIIYLGGKFTSLLATTRNLLGAVDNNGSMISNFNPNVQPTNAGVYDIQLNESEDLLYIGGDDITSVGGVLRKNAAAISTSDGSIDDWDPALAGTTSDYIQTILIDNGVVWLGGRFYTTNGLSIPNIAIVDEISGATEDWNSPYGIYQYGVNQITILDNTIYVLSSYAIGGNYKTNTRILLYDRNTRELLSDERASINGVPKTISFDEVNDKYFLGGTFTSFGGKVRNGLAAIDLSSRELIDWDPVLNAGAKVYDIDFNGSIIYIGGNFTSVGGYSRGNLAAVNACNGVTYDWDPDIKSGYVKTIELDEDKTELYVGGSFLYVGNTPVDRLASFNTNDYSLTDWRPSSSGDINDIIIYDPNVYLAGSFDYIEGELRSLIAGVDKDTGMLTSFDPDIPYNSNLTSESLAITQDGSKIFVGGRFYYDYLLGFNTADSSRITLPSFSMYDSILSIKISSDDSLLYFTGEYGTGIRTLDLTTNLLTGWSLALNSGAYAYSLDELNGTLFFGGTISSVGGQSVSYYGQNATYDLTEESYDCSILPEAPVEDPDEPIEEDDPLIVELNEVVYPEPRSTFSLPENLPNFNSIVSPVGSITDIERYGNMTYVAGSFDEVVGRASGMALPVDKITYEVTTGDFPVLDVLDGASYYGEVTVILPDGEGGWFIGGYFDRANEDVVSNLIHVLSDGSVDQTLLPVFTGTYSTSVKDLALSPDGTILYVGGAFTGVNGQTRNRLCSFDLTTNSLTSWDPNLNDWVRTVDLTSDGSILYVGGDFTTVGGLTQNRVVAFDTTTGNRIAWNPNPSGVVWDIEISDDDSQIFIGGNYTSIGGGSNDHIAIIDTAGVIVPTFAPVLDDYVRDIELDGSYVFVGGYFNTVNGQPRNAVAKIDLTGALDPWNAQVDNTIYGVHLDEGIIYLAGYFDSVGGETKSRLAAVDSLTGGLIDSFKLEADTMNGTLTFATDANYLYIGGYHTLIGYDIDQLFRIKDDGTIDKDFSYIFNGEINDIVGFKNKLYIGGDFTAVNGFTRNYSASIDLETGVVTSWNPYLDEEVESLAVAGNTVYIGGWFTRANGEERIAFAAFDDQSNIPTDLSIDITNSDWPVIYKILPHGEDLFIGGDFIYEDKENLLLLDPVTGIVSDWSPNPIGGYGVYELEADQNRLYVGGDFNSVNASNINYIVAFDLSDMSMVDLGLGLDDEVHALEITQESLFIGGYFMSPRYALMEVSLIEHSCPPPANIYLSESFEVDPYPPTGWSVDSGHQPWLIDTLNYSDGLRSTNSNELLGDSQVAVMSYTIDLAQESTLSFDWKVSSETDYDHLYYCIDNPSCTYDTDYESRISGEVDWTTVVKTLSSGMHTITWKYEKDSSSSAGSDQGWIDNVSVDDREECTPISEGSVTSWNPSPDSTPFVIHAVGNTLYVGGDMYTFGDYESFGFLAQFGELPAVVEDPEIEFGYLNQTIYENSGSGVIKLVLQKAPSMVPLSINYSITGGTADSGDYLLETGTIIIPAGEFSVDIPFTVFDNDEPDGYRTIFLNLSDPLGSSIGMYHASTITILDDEGGSIPPEDPEDPPVDPEDPPEDPEDPPVDPEDPPVDPEDPPEDPPVESEDPPSDPEILNDDQQRSYDVPQDDKDTEEYDNDDPEHGKEDTPSEDDHRDDKNSGDPGNEENGDDHLVPVKDNNMLNRITSKTYSLIAIIVGFIILLTQFFGFIWKLGGGVTQLIKNYPLIFGILFDKKRRKTGWGLVYDFTNQNEPIPFAIVKLVDVASSKIVSTTITDLEGRYRFITDEGRYIINVEHKDYAIATLNDPISKRYDLTGKYFGGVIQYKKERSVPYDIPMYPILSHDMSFYNKLKDKITIFVKNFGSLLNLFGVILIAISIVWYPSKFAYLVLLLNLIVLLIITVVNILHLKDWGVAFKDHRENRLEGVFIRLFDIQNRSLVNTVLTDRKGRYGFIADKGCYLLHAMRAELKMNNDIKIDVKNNRGKVIKTDIPMHRVYFGPEHPEK